MNGLDRFVKELTDELTLGLRSMGCRRIVIPIAFSLVRPSIVTLFKGTHSRQARRVCVINHAILGILTSVSLS